MVLFNLTMTAFATWAGMCSTLFLLHCIVVMGYIVGKHLRELNHQLRQAVTSFEQQQTFGANGNAGMAKNRQWLLRLRERQLRIFLQHYRRQHTLLLNTMLLFNQKVVAKTVLIATITDICVTLAMLTLLFFVPLNWIVRTHLVCLLFGFVVVYLSTTTLIYLSELLYGGRWSILAAQFALSSSRPSASRGRRLMLIREKWKLLAYFELLHTSDRIHFTLGSLARVTKAGLVESVLFYTGYLMYVFKMFMKK